MGNGFRRGLTRYGDEAFSYFLRRGFLKAAGYTEADLARPVVGIATSASDFNPCHATVPALVEAVKRGVLLGGGIPVAFPSISLHESFSYPTSMLYRNLMAMDVEEMIGAQPMDAVVLVGGCDKTVPAQLMGAVSADVPALSLVVGPMLTGSHEGQRLGACTDCRRLWASYRAGDISEHELATAGDCLMSTHGTCMVMGTASTMACLAETLGFMLPGGASIPAVHSERIRFAERTGRRASEMASNGAPRPSEFITKPALHNAMAVLQALGGSTNALIHLAAIAGRAGIEINLDAFHKLGDRTPVIVDLKPSGRHYMEDFHAAGGLPAVWRRLGSVLHGEARSASGKTITEEVEAAPAYVDDRIIRPLDEPVYPRGAIAVLGGSLAPQGAVIKLSATSGQLLQHQGAALVFDSLQDLAARIDDPELPVTAETILVLRHAGPVGAGMPEAGGFPIPRKLARQGIRDMVRISDARMSGTAYGTVVLHVSPEAAVGGPLALVDNGDMVRLDVEARRIDLLVDETELARRRQQWTSPPLPERSYKRLFARSVEQAHRGCDFDFLRGPRDESQ